MNEQRLEMKYHPAKKEVRFRRFVLNEDGKDVEKEVGSALRTYMNDRGNFVLKKRCRNLWAISLQSEKF